MSSHFITFHSSKNEFDRFNFWLKSSLLFYQSFRQTKSLLIINCLELKMYAISFSRKNVSWVKRNVFKYFMKISFYIIINVYIYDLKSGFGESIFYRESDFWFHSHWLIWAFVIKWNFSSMNVYLQSQRHETRWKIFRPDLSLLTIPVLTYFHIYPSNPWSTDIFHQLSIIKSHLQLWLQHTMLTF